MMAKIIKMLLFILPVFMLALGAPALRAEESVSEQTHAHMKKIKADATKDAKKAKKKAKKAEKKAKKTLKKLS